MLPASTGILDGSMSSDPEGESMSYIWEQVYGPSVITFSDTSVVSPLISNLESGIYQCRLTVSDGTYTSLAEVLVIVTDLANLRPYVTLTYPPENTSFFEAKSIELIVNAIDLDGTITLVEFFEGDNKIGEDQESPFSILWSGGSTGEHFITARATDNGGSETLSAPVTVIITPAPPCEGSPVNGDYTYRFTPEKNNPTITFIPGVAGAGSPTCILYYGTNATGPFPGNNVKPNIPFRITASEGSIIYFYYTYSYPGGERNTSAAMHSYEIGSCSGSDPFLTVLTTSLSVAAGLNSKATFTIDTNVECTISSDQSWLTLSSGTVNQYSTITVTAEENQTTAQRTAIVTITGAGVITKVISVKQSTLSTSVKEMPGDEISVYPVPAGDLIYISGLKEPAIASIYNVCGNLMLTKILDISSNGINLSPLSKGLYIIKLQTSNKLIIKQFSKL
jgi:hypothetical protein